MLGANYISLLHLCSCLAAGRLLAASCERGFIKIMLRDISRQFCIALVPQLLHIVLFPRGILLRMCAGVRTFSVKFFSRKRNVLQCDIRLYCEASESVYFFSSFHLFHVASLRAFREFYVLFTPPTLADNPQEFGALIYHCVIAYYCIVLIVIIFLLYFHVKYAHVTISLAR